MAGSLCDLVRCHSFFLLPSALLQSNQLPFSDYLTGYASPENHRQMLALVTHEAKERPSRNYLETLGLYQDSPLKMAYSMMKLIKPETP